ncbi:Uncharacterised protein [Mycobacteroides abscessus subsp. massiliense]|nr:Uncharacterised protein [Mycobacteroides abscessus subsp. massiliense]
MDCGADELVGLALSLELPQALRAKTAAPAASTTRRATRRWRTMIQVTPIRRIG